MQSQVESDRVFELASRLYGGDVERANRFLATPHPMLGGETALALAASGSAGADEVMNLLRAAEASFAV